MSRNPSSHSRAGGISRADLADKLNPTHLSIKWKVFVPVAGIVLAAFLGYAYIGLRAAEHELLGKTDRSASVVAAMVEHVLRPAVARSDDRTLSSLLADLAGMPELQALRVLRPDGTLRAGHDQERGRTAVEAIRRQTAPLRLEAADAPSGTAGRLGGDWIYHVVRVIRRSDQEPSGAPIGFLELDLSVQDTRDRIEEGRIELTFISLVTLFVLAAALMIVINTLVSDPLAELSGAMSRVEAGDLKARAHIRSGDELERLGHSFNRMVEEIEGKNEQILRSEKLASIGLLAAGVAHEINNPVATISMSAEGLYETEPSSERRRFLRAIIGESERIGTIVRHLLGFERGGYSAYEPASLTAILRAAEEDLRWEAERAGVVVTLDLDMSPDTLMGQADQLRQAFVNIMDNAIRAMDQGGRLDVRAETENERAKIHFHDTGPGISEEHQIRIFDPFFTTREVGEGFGLGLAACYEIIKRHNGDIQVQSGSDGTTFTIELPLAKETDSGEIGAPHSPGR